MEIMKTLITILVITGAITWLVILLWPILMMYSLAKVYVFPCILIPSRNLIVAYLWFKMPIEELNEMWEKFSRKGYRRIRGRRRLSWLGRYILVKRVRKYRNNLNKRRNGRREK
ncbi:hypothetical protein [Bacteroides reticulotermitis]|uniref:hypothetical protein n=1 Tax=Bacteroides reticulotermitis TaxID=1133319 RepID=UPI0005C62B09|nr:hypothetical protein [Bacteroides reticulotermitis]